MKQLVLILEILINEMTETENIEDSDKNGNDFR